MVALAAQAPHHNPDHKDMTDIEFWDLENDGETARQMMRDAMRTKRLSQERLGSLLEPPAGQTQVNKWLMGKQVPRGARREQIAKILDLPLHPRIKEDTDSVQLRPLGGDVDRAGVVTELLAIRTAIDSLLARI